MVGLQRLGLCVAALPHSSSRLPALFAQLALLRQSARHIANYRQRHEDELPPSRLDPFGRTAAPSTATVAQRRFHQTEHVFDGAHPRYKHYKHAKANCYSYDECAYLIKSAFRQVRHDCSCKSTEWDVYQQLKKQYPAFRLEKQAILAVPVRNHTTRQFGRQVEVVVAKELSSMVKARKLERTLKRKKNPRLAVSILKSAT